MRTITNRLPLLSGAFAAQLLLAAPAWAQFQDYDINCNVVEIDELQKYQREVCTAHAGCRLVDKIMQTTCKAKQFYNRMTQNLSPGSSMTSDTVFNSIPSEVPESSLAQRMIQNAKNAANSLLHYDNPEGKLVRNSGGSFTYDDRQSLSGGGSVGTYIFPDGSAVRGRFNSNNRVEGPAHLIKADGRMRAGNFSGNHMDGVMTTRDGDRTSGARSRPRGSCPRRCAGRHRRLCPLRRPVRFIRRRVPRRLLLLPGQQPRQCPRSASGAANAPG